jgi:hypothetical protein
MTMHFSTKSFVCALSGSLLAMIVAVGCRDPKTSNNGVEWSAGGQNSGFPPPTGTVPTATAPATTTAPTATATATTPPTATATATATAAPIDPTLLQALLKPLQAQHAPGMQPEGTPLSGMLQTGQSLQTSVIIAASGTRCYTGIAVGAPTVTDIAVELIASPPPPLPPGIVSQSQGVANPAIMAGKPNCFKNLLPIPGPAIFKVTARGGSGPVLAQLYAKLNPRGAAGILRGATPRRRGSRRGRTPPASGRRPRGNAHRRRRSRPRG